MDTLRHGLLDSLERWHRGRPVTRLVELIPPPGGADEQVSPFTLALLENGIVGVCWNLLDSDDQRAAYDATDFGSYHGRDALELTRELLAEDRTRRIVGYAVCSALSQALMIGGEIAVDLKTDLLDLAGVRSTDRVGLVGNAPPLLDQLVSREAQVVVLDREAVFPVERDVKIARSPGDLASCQVVLISSTTLLDDSFAEIERSSSQARFRAVFGPGAAIVPEALFRRGIDAIAGMLITDGPALVERQRNGELWRDAKRKFVLRRR